MIEGNTSQPLLVRRRKASRGPRTMTRAEALHRDLRGLQIAPQSSGAATFKEESLSRDVRSEEVRCGHSSCETCEQQAVTPCGADGAKGHSRGESGRPKHVPHSEAGKRAT